MLNKVFSGYVLALISLHALDCEHRELFSREDLDCPRCNAMLDLGGDVELRTKDGYFI